MPWRAISIDEVRFTPAETALMQNIQGATDVGPDILANVIGEFRDTIAAAGTAASAGTAEIPDLVRLHVVNRTRWQWVCEFPALKSMQTKDRADLNAAAEKMLAQISSRDVKVPPGDGSAANQVTSPSFGDRCGTFTGKQAPRDFTRGKQDGR